MAGLRIGIDVGGTFTHGVALRPPGEVVATARTPTTHRDPRGVAAGVATVLRELLAALAAQGIGAEAVELVAHSTTQATNALLEGDVAPVTRIVLVPPGEGLLVRRALAGRRLDIGNGHWIELETQYLKLEASGRPSLAANSQAAFESPAGTRVFQNPVAVIQPLAGRQELRERQVADSVIAAGGQAVCAGEITQVLGLTARARTATVNAAMLPKMLATADFTEAAVREVLGQAGGQQDGGAGGSPVSSGPLLQVVRSDGGAMSIAEMRRQPVLSLLSGPAAGASAALHLSGLSEVVFIEVGGTSTDITLISEGRVRHRYAAVGGQRLMVPSLDLRTVPVGGGSMLRADKPLFGPRSAHIAGLPYLFQALADGRNFVAAERWTEPGSSVPYTVARMEDGSLAAFTMTDFRLTGSNPQAAKLKFDLDLGSDLLSALRAAMPELGELVNYRVPRRMKHMQVWMSQRYGEEIGQPLNKEQVAAIRSKQDHEGTARAAHAFVETCELISYAIMELARSHGVNLAHFTLVGGGGGAPVVYQIAGSFVGIKQRAKLIPHHAVISAIGAALAVTCVSLSKSCAAPTAADIAQLVGEVEQKLTQQGAERVSTDYEYDPQRQVLTVTGRGSRPYEQSATPQTAEQLVHSAGALLGEGSVKLWDGGDVQLWQAGPLGGAGLSAGRHRLAGAEARPTRRNKGRDARLSLAQDRFGRSLWLGRLAEYFPVAPGERDGVLKHILDTRTQYSDGGPLLPGLALLCAGRFLPLDQLGSAELIADILRLEDLPPGAAGCFILRR